MSARRDADELTTPAHSAAPPGRPPAPDRPPAAEPDTMALSTIPPPAAEPDTMALSTIPPPAAEPDTMALSTIPPPAAEPDSAVLSTTRPPPRHRHPSTRAWRQSTRAQLGQPIRAGLTRGRLQSAQAWWRQPRTWLRLDHAEQDHTEQDHTERPPSAPATQPDRRMPLTAVLIGVGLVLALLGAITVAPHPTVAGLIGLLIVGVCLTALALTAIRGPFAPIALSFWAFVVVWVGFPPLLQIRDDRLPWADTPLTTLFPTAQMILLLAVTAFGLGYALPVHAVPPATRPASGPTRRPALTSSAAVTVTAATALAAVVAIPATGGLLVRFTSRDQLKAAIQGTGLISGSDQALVGLVNTLPAAASLCALVVCLVCLRSRLWSDRRSRRLLIAATSVAVVLNVIFNNPFSATRFAFFSVVLAAFLCVVDLRSRPRQVGFAALMLGGLALIYPLANLFRNTSSRDRLRMGLDAYYTFDFDGFQQTVNSVYYVNTHGHTWGHHVISALLFWVPRSVWEAKAFPTGIAVADARGYQFKNLALPLWAEMYVEYSWVGVALLMFCYGMVARRLDRIIQRQSATAATVLALLFAACQIGLLRGPIGAQLPFVAAAFVVAIAGMTVWPRRAGPGSTRTPEGPPCTD